MDRTHPRATLRGIALAVVTGALAVGSTGCELAVDPGYPGGGGIYSDYPPDAYVATTEPFYFDGRASYWYGNRWYYRQGGGWGHYDREPAGLRQQRMAGQPRRRMYESPGARPAGRSSGRGGGRSAGHR
jgi:hypothetical protein